MEPTGSLNAPILRAVTGGTKNKPFEWTDNMEAEYQFLKNSMKKSLKLSPYDPIQKLRLIIDGSRTIRTHGLHFGHVL